MNSPEKRTTHGEMLLRHCEPFATPRGVVFEIPFHTDWLQCLVTREALQAVDILRTTQFDYVGAFRRHRRLIEARALLLSAMGLRGSRLVVRLHHLAEAELLKAVKRPRNDAAL